MAVITHQISFEPFTSSCLSHQSRHVVLDLLSKLLLLCCSWGPTWGLKGTFKIAYGAAYVMQPVNTFALQYKADMMARAAQIEQRFRTALKYDATKPGCLLYTAKQPQRLLKLADDSTTLADAAASALHVQGVSKADVLADVVASNLGYTGSLSAASKRPFRLCGKTVQLLSSLLLPQSPSPSPIPASPSPQPIPLPSPGPGKCSAAVHSCTAI
jgi:hypothetical protein